VASSTPPVLTDAACSPRRIASASARAFAGLKPWQLVTALAYGVNVLAVSVPGRIDGEMQRRAQAEARAAKAKDENAKEKTHAIPLDSEYRSLFTPAGWAFAIWGAIYAGEFALVAHALASASGGGASEAATRAVAPSWALACAFQALWCAAFRPWAKAPRHFWVSSALLVAEAVALGSAHRALRAAASAASKAWYWTTHVPLSMHFGWISCAALVNLNSHVAKTCAPDTQLATAFLSAFGAGGLGAAVTLTTGDPVYALVIAWALTAVASDGGKRTTETLADVPLKALTKAARWGARAALASVVVSQMPAFAA